MRTPPSPIVLGTLLLVAAASGDVRAQWTQEYLSQARAGLGATSVDGKLFFAGGDLGGLTPTGLIDVYEEAADTWSTSALPTPRVGPAATAVGDYALFVGGHDGNGDTSAVVEILHVPTGVWTEAELSVARRWMGATTVGNTVLFAGGQTGSIFSPVFSAVVDIYDADLGDPDDPAAWSTATLSEARSLPAPTTVGDLALFAGGFTGTDYSATVDVYDDSTGLWSTTMLSEPRIVGVSSAVTVGTRAYFAGGFNHLQPEPMADVVDVYDAQTETWTKKALSVARGGPAAAAVGHTILFAGGNTAPGIATDLVDVLDSGTGAWLTPTHLAQERAGIVMATVNGKAFFAGGTGFGGSISDLVDVYQPIFAGSWSGLGSWLPGAHGDPVLVGDGPLLAGSAGSLTLTDAADAGAPAILFVSLAGNPTPFKGGTLIPVPSALQFGFSTVGSPGSITLPWSSWPAGLSGASLFFQCGVQDAGAVHGVALSNALRADVP